MTVHSYQIRTASVRVAGQMVRTIVGPYIGRGEEEAAYPIQRGSDTGMSLD